MHPARRVISLIRSGRRATSPSPNPENGSGLLQDFVDTSTGLIEDVRVWKPGDTISVIGFAGRYKETHEIMPRIALDVARQATD